MQVGFHRLRQSLVLAVHVIAKNKMAIYIVGHGYPNIDVNLIYHYIFMEQMNYKIWKKIIVKKGFLQHLLPCFKC